MGPHGRAEGDAEVEGGMTDDGIKVQTLRVAGNGMTLTASGTASRGLQRLPPPISSRI